MPIGKPRTGNTFTGQRGAAAPALTDTSSSRAARSAAARRALCVLAAGCLIGASLGLAACSSRKAPAAPPAGSITDDRSLGDILVRFSPPEVTTSEEAGKLLAVAKGPVRFVVKRPMSAGIWLVTAITADENVTLDQAMTTLRALPRIQDAEPDRLRAPSRPMPTSRDMPAR